MTITVPMQRVLRALADSPMPMTPGQVGRAIWPSTAVGMRRKMAGSVLRGLERRRLADRERIESTTGEDAFSWRATEEGRRVLRSIEVATT